MPVTEWILLDDHQEVKEKCKGVEMKTGFRDCWTLNCPKDHTWRMREIKEKDDIKYERAL